VSEPARGGGQDRGRRPTPLPKHALRPRHGLLWDSIIPVAVAVFGVVLQVCLFKIYLLADRQAGKLRPLIAKLQNLAHLIEELRMRIVASPAPAIAKFDDILLPTLVQGEPSAGGTVVRALLPFRHEASQKRRGIGACG